MKRVFIIQARMTSTRLPGKVLMNLAGRPMLARQVQRLQYCTTADDIVIATTSNATDDAVVDLAQDLGIRCFRGDEHDVLGRYLGAAREARAEVVVRLTADCPLIDPVVVDRVVNELTEHACECDYAANVLERTFPKGLDVEAFFFDTLLRMDRLGTTNAAREHVTVVLRCERPELFMIRSVKDKEDNSDLRWTIDAQPDLDLVRALYESLDLSSGCLQYKELIAHVRDHPEFSAMNSGIETWDPMQDKY